MVWHPYVLLAFPEDLAAVREAIPPDVAVLCAPSWWEARTALKQWPQIQRVFFSSSRLDARGLRYLRRLRRQNRFVELTLYCDTPSFGQLEKAVKAAEAGAHIIHPPDLGEKVRRLIRRPPDAVADYALAVAGARPDDTVTEFYELLAEDPEAVTLRSGDIARRMGVSRTTLFEMLRTANSPPIHSVQLLFRALTAWSALRAGWTEADAARASGYSEASSLRRAVERGLSLSLSDIRETEDWRQIVDVWGKSASAEVSAA